MNKLSGRICRRTIVVPSTAGRGWLPADQFAALASVALPLGIHAGWSAPIFSSSGKVLGTVAKYYHEDCESLPQDHLLGEIVTRTAATVIESRRTQEARGRLAALVQSSDDAIVSKDLNGTIQTWNMGAERLFGYTALEAIGHPISMLIPADHADEETNILARIRRGERIEHYETIRRRRDGTLVKLQDQPFQLLLILVDRPGEIVGASKLRGTSLSANGPNSSGATSRKESKHWRSRQLRATEVNSLASLGH